MVIITGCSAWNHSRYTPNLKHQITSPVHSFWKRWHRYIWKYISTSLQYHIKYYYHMFIHFPCLTPHNKHVFQWKNSLLCWSRHNKTRQRIPMNLGNCFSLKPQSDLLISLIPSRSLSFLKRKTLKQKHVDTVGYYIGSGMVAASCKSAFEIPWHA